MCFECHSQLPYWRLRELAKCWWQTSTFYIAGCWWVAVGPLKGNRTARRYGKVLESSLVRRPFEVCQALANGRAEAYRGQNSSRRQIQSEEVRNTFWIKTWILRSWHANSFSLLMSTAADTSQRVTADCSYIISWPHPGFHGLVAKVCCERLKKWQRIQTLACIT